MSYFIGSAILVALAITLFAIRQSKQTKQTLNELSASLGATELTSGSEYRGELEGQIYHYQYHSGGNNSPSYFKVWVECESKGEFTVGKETRFDLLSKRLGIAAEIQTGDRQFDSDFYIRTDSVAFTKNYFLNLPKRQSARQLYDSGYTLLTHNGQTMEARISPFSIDKLTNSEMIHAAVRNLSALSKDLPASFYQPRVLGIQAWKVERSLIFIIAGLSIAAGLAGIMWGLKTYPPLDGWDLFVFSAQFSVAALAIYTFLSVVMIRGRSSSHKELLVAFLIALFGFPMTGFGGLMVLNGYLDESDATYHEARITDRRFSKSKDSSSYYVTVVSWRANHETEEIKVTYDIYSQVKSDESIMRVGTHKGKYGFEWIKEYRIL